MTSHPSNATSSEQNHEPVDTILQGSDLGALLLDNKSPNTLEKIVPIRSPKDLKYLAAGGEMLRKMPSTELLQILHQQTAIDNDTLREDDMQLSLIEKRIYDNTRQIIKNMLRTSGYQNQNALSKEMFKAFHTLFTREFRSFKEYKADIGPYFSANFTTELMFLLRNGNDWKLPQEESDLEAFFTGMFEIALEQVRNGYHDTIGYESLNNEHKNAHFRNTN